MTAEAIDLCRAWVDTGDTGILRELTIALNSRVSALAGAGRDDKALQAAAEVVRLLQRRRDVNVADLLGDALCRLVELRAARGMLDAALVAADEHLQLARSLYAADPTRRMEGLVIPFGASGGHVQVDVVFGEPLALPPEPLALPGVTGPLLAASAPLSLAWKLTWLVTDNYPQAKDLYDAALLACIVTVDLGLVRDLMRPELGARADTFTAETVLSWTVDDWAEFTAAHPHVGGTAEDWLRRLATGLGQGWSV